MKRLILLCLPLLLAPLFAHSQDKSRIVALENSWNQAELHNDAHAVDLLHKGKPFERRGRFTDTWINLSGQWRCVASHFSVKP